MRIIKKGKKPEVTAEITCEYCSTVFEVTPIDVTKSKDICGRGYDYTVICPICQQELDISNCKIDDEPLYLVDRFTKFCSKG